MLQWHPVPQHWVGMKAVSFRLNIEISLGRCDCGERWQSLSKGHSVHLTTQPHGTRGNGMGTVLVQLEVMNSFFIWPNDKAPWLIMVACHWHVFRGNKSAGSPLPLLFWEAGRELGRSEPDGQRGMVVKLLFSHNTRLRVRQRDINKKNSSWPQKV